MRVAIVASPHVPIPPSKYGGTERVIFSLIKGLKEIGHEPILFGPGDSTVDCELVPTVKEAVYFPPNPSEFPKFKKHVDRINKQTESIVRKYLPRIDIIHSHGVDLINFQDFPNLTTIHGMFILPEVSYYLERRNLYYATISKNQQGGCPDLQYVGVVYNGLDPGEFPIVKKPKDYLCWVGRFDHEKSPHYAIQLAISLGMHIKIAGKIDFQGKEYFDREIRPYLRHPLVEYLGEIGGKDKVDLVSYAKCNLHPTNFREPFGLTILEAAYGGTPTLAIARGSLPELIEDGRTGVLVEDFVEGYYQMEKCFEMDRKYIAHRSRLLFNYRVMAEQYVKAYQSVIDLFATRKYQDNLILDMTQGTKQEIANIWETKTQPKKATSKKG
jgi:glycosyltransferase involved in cell wall biosynthesis